MSRPAGIAARLDGLPLTPLHVGIAVLCGLGLVIDVAELSLNGALSVVFSTPPNRMEPFALGLLVASVFLGAAVGAPLLGRLADRHGRRLTLRLSLVVVAVPSFAAALGPDGAWLTTCRFAAGLALGAYPPLMTAYLTDVLPPRWRARIILIAVSIGVLGWPAVIFAVRWLSPIAPLGLEGWRWSLIGAGAAAAAMAWAFRHVPESPRWLAVAGRPAEAERACRRFEDAAGIAAVARGGVGEAARGPALQSGREAATAGRAAAGAAAIDTRLPDGYWQRVTLIATVYLLRAWPTIGFPTVAGAMLVVKGWGAGDSLLFVGIAGFGASFGALAASFVVDRFERRTALTLCSLAMVGFGIAFAASDTALGLVVAGTAFNVVGAIYGPVLSVYAAELFPTARRATATATAWGANRLGSALAPLALLPLLAVGGPMAVLATIALATGLNLVLILAFGPRGFAGRPVPG